MLSTNSENKEQRHPLGQIPVEMFQTRSNSMMVTNVNDLIPLMAEKLHISLSNNNNENGKATTEHDILLAHNDEKIGKGFDDINSSTNNLKVDNEIIDWEKERKDMDRLFEQQCKNQLKDLPAFDMPPFFQKNFEFFDYQKDGIRWLLQQERNPSSNPFVRTRTLNDGSTALYDYFTRGRLSEAHAPIKGSILADDMGLGKTIQTLALVLSNPPSFQEDECHNNEKPICTVIVCPKTVISNWIQQIEDYIVPGKMCVETYTGTPKRRSKIIEQVKNNKVNVLLSTYETITCGFEKTQKDTKGNKLEDIFDCEFHRIVLDEAQQIRDPKSKRFKAILSVACRSQYRLALTGTPFVNKPDDIHSLLSFIDLKPLSDPKNFNYYITQPIKERRRAGLTRLRTALAYVALRRTKNIIPNLNIVDKTVQVCHIDFPEGDEHKIIYDCLYGAIQAAFDASINGSGRRYTESERENEAVNVVTQQALFGMLLRVRQACNSGALVVREHYERASKIMNEYVKDENGNTKISHLSASEGERMIDLLRGNGGAPLKRDIEEGHNNKEKQLRIQTGSRPPKVSALLNSIAEMAQDEKAVIFSQWTSFLDIVGNSLAQEGHQYTRIDGSMSTEERTLALHKLGHDDNVRFILCSLKACGVGINLTRANVVYMMDPWWNHSVEAQAIDRCHRVGQIRAVRVYRLVMKGTIEERMLNIQKAKQVLGKGTMTKLTKAEEKMAKMTGLRDLFQIPKIREGGLDCNNGANDWC